MSLARRLGGLILVAGLLGGCATTAADGEPSDPFEGVNRKIYAFNKVLDDNVLAPVARGYKNNVNQVFRYSIASFFSNLEDVLIGANNLLQGKPGAAVNDFTRVMLNSTLGFVGLTDLASEMGFRKNNEDFGQTLGAWGVPPGPYLVLPLFGPSDVRDFGGFIVDSLTDPLNEVAPDGGSLTAASATRINDTRARLLGASNLMQGIALDEYSFLRDAYLGRRRNLVYDGNPPLSEDE
ncbi:MAG: VacJ family lipoprotein [Burkholderiaceae bacterium]